MIIALTLLAFGVLAILWAISSGSRETESRG